jgi:hypothetical protein
VTDSEEILAYREQIEEDWHNQELDIPIVMLDDVLFQIGWHKGLRKEQLVSWAKDHLEAGSYPSHRVLEDPFDLVAAHIADIGIEVDYQIPQIITSIRRLAVESCQSCWRPLTLDEIEDRTNTEPQCSPCRGVQMNHG